MLHLVWEGKKGKQAPAPEIQEIKKFAQSQLTLFREDHLRNLNPTTYKVSVSSELYDFVHELWMKKVPVQELS